MLRVEVSILDMPNLEKVVFAELVEKGYAAGEEAIAVVQLLSEFRERFPGTDARLHHFGLYCLTEEDFEVLCNDARNAEYELDETMSTETKKFYEIPGKPYMWEIVRTANPSPREQIQPEQRCICPHIDLEFVTVGEAVRFREWCRARGLEIKLEPVAVDANVLLGFVNVGDMGVGVRGREMDLEADWDELTRNPAHMGGPGLRVII